jgi:hypothetical protein
MLVVYVCVCVCVHDKVLRERERERESCMDKQAAPYFFFGLEEVEGGSLESESLDLLDLAEAAESGVLARVSESSEELSMVERLDFFSFLSFLLLAICVDSVLLDSASGIGVVARFDLLLLLLDDSGF